MTLVFYALRYGAVAALALMLVSLAYGIASAPTRIASRLGLRGLKRQRAIAKNEAWANVEPVVRWLIWHHLYGWLSKAEFTLGLALALTHAMGLVTHDQTIEHLVDLAIEVQTVRSCLVATERDPRFTNAGYCVPNHAHLAAGGLAMLKARPLIVEIAI